MSTTRQQCVRSHTLSLGPVRMLIMAPTLVPQLCKLGRKWTLGRNGCQGLGATHLSLPSHACPLSVPPPHLRAFSELRTQLKDIHTISSGWEESAFLAGHLGRSSIVHAGDSFPSIRVTVSQLVWSPSCTGFRRQPRGTV